VKDTGKTYVLVHGAFHGGWCWKAVAAQLRAAGHTVYTPTQTGSGERSHLLHARPTLDTVVEDIAQVLRFEELQDVILVGHSFGGATVSALADRMPERLRHLVYLDAQLLQSGEGAVDHLSPEHRERYLRGAVESSAGLSIPPNAPEYYGITDPALGDWLMTKLTPQPLRTFTDPLVLKHPLGNGLPVTYIACAQPYFPTTTPSREMARRMPGWSYLEIATAHNAMTLMPRELTAMLGAIG
jgi:pimeloyl-ACP methyl ester carboxylesterase